ncbi:MAG: glycosyltransferase family 2 protein [Planctomycetota bacterium]|jgi:dolichol-phosphate mannosyltransferase
MAEIKGQGRKPNGPNRRRSEAATLVAIPVYNEVSYVDDVLRAVRRYSESILVVNDGSTDGTADMLRGHSYVHVISHEANVGYGQSLIDAFGFARGREYDWLITIDCDYQHEPSFIPHFYREIQEDDADIISGSRYLRGVNDGSLPPPPERVAINRRITGILNANLGIELTDSFCGFKAYRTGAVHKLKLTEQGYRLPLQLWIRASRAGLRIREIPVPMIYHDPARKFCGPFEEAQKRFDYYIEIIERELGGNVSQGVAGSFHSER